MSKLRKSFITVLAVLLCATLSVSAAFLIPKTEKAVAKTVSSAHNVEELTLIDYKTRSDHFTFYGTNMQKLYKNLTGNGDAKFSDVQALAVSTLTASQISTNAGGEFVVKLGEKDWIPTYLSTAKNGDVILTLWLAESSQTYQWNEWARNNTEYEYPSNLYSTSKIRSYLTGSQYIGMLGADYTTPNTDLSSGVQNATWAEFISNFGSYIATPSVVEWQEHQTARKNLIANSGVFSNGYNFDLPNDSWGEPGDSHPQNSVTGESWYSNDNGTVDMEKL